MTTSVHFYHRLGPPSSINNDTATLHTVISALRFIQKIICKCCERIGQKSDAFIIRGPKFLPPSLRIKMNKFNTLHGDEPTEQQRKWNSQPTSDHLKPSTLPPKTSPVVSAIMERLNHNDIDNGDVEVHPSDFLAEYNPEYVPDTDANMIK